MIGPKKNINKMTTFIKVYDENGKYVINPSDCPIMVTPGSTIVYDLNGNITICPKPRTQFYKDPNEIITIDLKTGFIKKLTDNKLFINHPKYGIIHNPAYDSTENCFDRWNEEDPYEEPKGFVVVDDLLTLDELLLIEFLKPIIDYANTTDGQWSPKDRLNIAWHNCFGQFYGNLEIDKLNELTKEELVYFILNCENYFVADFKSSIWDLEKHGIFKPKKL